MPYDIEAVTTASLALALDAAAMRQQVIAANIANADVQGYAARGVSFEAVVEGGLGRGADALRTHLQPHIAPMRGEDGLPMPVQLDTEMAALSQNQLQYQALVKGLNKHLAVLSLAVSDGKR